MTEAHRLRAVPGSPIGIFTAVPAELSGILGLLKSPSQIRLAGRDVTCGTLAGLSVVAGNLGIGSRAGETLQELLRDIRPCALFLVGFAGGIAPEVAPGAALLADPVRLEDASLHPDEELLHLALRAAESEPIRMARGPARTMPHQVLEVADKEEVRAREPDLLAVDMENGHIARVCRDEGIPFLPLRVVFDAAFEALPDMAPVLDEDGAVRPLKLPGFILRRPSRALDLLHLGRRYGQVRPILDRWVAATVGSMGCGGGFQPPVQPPDQPPDGA